MSDLAIPETEQMGRNAGSYASENGRHNQLNREAPQNANRRGHPPTIPTHSTLPQQEGRNMRPQTNSNDTHGTDLHFSKVSTPTNRVKVAIRCRPPFQEEGPASIVAIPPPPPGRTRTKAIQLEYAANKRKEFKFDAVFGPEASNSQVYDTIAGPIVDGVMKGTNGTVLAYGQTGSGKTHSLGILTRVTSESGIIPRALSHIFGYINATNETERAKAKETGLPPTKYTVTMSFLQLYLDSVHDLLVSPTPAAPNARESSRTGAASGLSAPLPVREDPTRGFYVDGLSEYVVNSFSEAISLLNYGLTNRVIGDTKMNATSSRSHTILILQVEAKQYVPRPEAKDGQEPGYGFITRRSQLMLCDLAGSERVRRTSSRGARLEEARAINSSLHTLGQVVSSLSFLSTHPHKANARAHIPWRNSKLTRILHGNLGGGANTYLLATVGPSALNASESFSTLRFASHCMRITATSLPSLTTPNTDYAELCAALQVKLSEAEATATNNMTELSNRYQHIIDDLRARNQQLQERYTALHSKHSELETAYEALQKRYQALLQNPSSSTFDANDALIRSPTSTQNASQSMQISPLQSVHISLFEDDEEEAQWTSSAGSPSSPPILQILYAFLCLLYDQTVVTLTENYKRHKKADEAWKLAIERAKLTDAKQTPIEDMLHPYATEEDTAKSFQLHAPAITDPSNVSDTALQRVLDSGASMNAITETLSTLPLEHLSSTIFEHTPSPPSSNTITTVHLLHPSNHTGAEVVDIYANSSKFAPGAGKSYPPIAPAHSGPSTLFHPDHPNAFATPATVGQPIPPHPEFSSFASMSAFVDYCTRLAIACCNNIRKISALLPLKDNAFQNIKKHLAAAEATINSKEKAAHSQRIVLKYLMQTAAAVREQVRLLREQETSLDASLLHDGNSSDIFSHSAASSPTPDTPISLSLDRSITPPRRHVYVPASPTSSEPTPHVSFPRSPDAFQVPTPRTDRSAPLHAPLLASSLAAHSSSELTIPTSGIASKAATNSHSSSSSNSPLARDMTVHAPNSISAPSVPKPPLHPTSSMSTSPLATEHSPDNVSTQDSELFHDDDEDEIECIVAHRLVSAPDRSSSLLYRVRWKASTPEEDEWFLRADLIQDFPNKVKEYEEKQRKKVQFAI